MILFVNTLLFLSFFPLTYTVNATPPINPIVEELHKVVLISKTDLLKPIKRCEINGASNSTLQNTHIIVRACNAKAERHQLFDLRKAIYFDAHLR